MIKWKIVLKCIYKLHNLDLPTSTTRLKSFASQLTCIPMGGEDFSWGGGGGGQGHWKVLSKQSIGGATACPSKALSKGLVTMTLTNVVRTIFYHLRNGQKIVRTTFVRVIVTKPLSEPSDDAPGRRWGLVNIPSWLPPLKKISHYPHFPPPPILKSWCHHCPCALYPNLLLKEDGVSVHLSCLCQWLYSTVLVDLNECPSIFQKVQQSHSRHQKTTSNFLRINLKGILKFNEIWSIEGAMYITLWYNFRGLPKNVSFMQFSQEIYGFRQKDSQGF